MLFKAVFAFKRSSNELKLRISEKDLLEPTGKDSYIVILVPQILVVLIIFLDNCSNLDLKISKLFSSVFGINYYLILVCYLIL